MENKINLTDVQLQNKHNWAWVLSLKKLTGLEIEDIEISVTHEFGDYVIKLDHIRFTSGHRVEIGGEHDIAFLYEDTELPNADTKTLEELHNQIKESR